MLCLVCLWNCSEEEGLLNEDRNAGTVVSLFLFSFYSVSKKQKLDVPDCLVLACLPVYLSVRGKNCGWLSRLLFLVLLFFFVFVSTLVSSFLSKSNSFLNS